jgi:hypothetical protein
MTRSLAIIAEPTTPRYVIRSQLAARQGRFSPIYCIQETVAKACTEEGVHFVFLTEARTSVHAICTDSREPVIEVESAEDWIATNVDEILVISKTTVLYQKVIEERLGRPVHGYTHSD